MGPSFTGGDLFKVGGWCVDRIFKSRMSPFQKVSHATLAKEKLWKKTIRLVCSVHKEWIQLSMIWIHIWDEPVPKSIPCKPCQQEARPKKDLWQAKSRTVSQVSLVGKSMPRRSSDHLKSVALNPTQQTNRNKEFKDQWFLSSNLIRARSKKK